MPTLPSNHPSPLAPPSNGNRQHGPPGQPRNQQVGQGQGIGRGPGPRNQSDQLTDLVHQTQQLRVQNLNLVVLRMENQNPPIHQNPTGWHQGNPHAAPALQQQWAQQPPLPQSTVGNAHTPVPYVAPVAAPHPAHQYPTHPVSFPLPPPQYVNTAPHHHQLPQYLIDSQAMPFTTPLQNRNVFGGYPHPPPPQWNASDPMNFTPPQQPRQVVGAPSHQPPQYRIPSQAVHFLPPDQYDPYGELKFMPYDPRVHPSYSQHNSEPQPVPQNQPSSSSQAPRPRLVPYQFVPASSQKLELATMSKEEAWIELNKVSLSEDQLHKNGFAVIVPGSTDPFISDPNVLPPFKMASVRCNRCRNLFTSNGPCRYHEDRTWNSLCCGKKKGCRSFPEHVHSKLSRKELQSFRCTPRSEGEHDQRNTNVFALDTEMVYTENGLEAARVTIVDNSPRTVLDIYIKPSGRVVDFNTQFSGIKPGELDDGVTLEEARAQLFSKINEKSLLVGHHLANDLKALRIIHTKIVDTAVLFMVNGRFPALKKLAGEHLKKIIHEDENGHDPVEDATICLEIVQEKWGYLRDKCSSPWARRPQ